jgi:AbrB family looped-hinge helix DNA binding protein
VAGIPSSSSLLHQLINAQSQILTQAPGPLWECGSSAAAFSGYPRDTNSNLAAANTTRPNSASSFRLCACLIRKAAKMPFTFTITHIRMPSMTTKTTIDKAGRIIVPKRLREKMRLEPGDDLLIEADGERLTLKPVRQEALLKKEYGIWVYQGEVPNIPIVEWLDDQREKRSHEILG